MTEILEEIHYMPDLWKEKPHTVQVSIMEQLPDMRSNHLMLLLHVHVHVHNLHVHTKFRSSLKIYEKSNFDWNQLKISTQHKNMYMYQKM